MNYATRIFSNYYIPSLQISNVIEIAFMAFVLYYVLLWIKNTRAFALMRGLIILAAFSFLAVALQLKTLIWIVQRTFSVGFIALVIIFQPELRRVLEQLGQGQLMGKLLKTSSREDSRGERFSRHTEEELIRASFAMGAAKTGALIVIEKNMELVEFIKTGIEVDGIVSSQLLINIFEHNTPLHDGAVIVRGDRIISATCYLPLTENVNLSKALGTRHRAGVGISEVTDSLTIIVSEETGVVSVAERGRLDYNVTREALMRRLEAIRYHGGFSIKPLGLFRNRKKAAHERKDS
ncbi:MAG: diadenylate cyclase CdaA [Lachnospiraceae bacterium]|nr:diadenylate cyclase CdaA [Lachnospiraceae bacterium]MCH4030230.1 diadenylate cyclase CdaA [Lachnospiraceae bacterium]MCH4069442.1 diadenylate cyclase CdaA [Lachnospiraceae bacterium]MCH4107622.1 diadenylate cyclase CdaA [Lachnospiraceae bacterium]MCI1301527.1 diadenylate cyclase CdaA [Lachnospiraceae bacterium]